MAHLLETIETPDDLKALKPADLPVLCAEIRQVLIDTVSQTGGHLASNLGVVELTVAMHRAFSAPEDAIVFDVGHQCYTHKLLTGRRDHFSTLRQKDGLAGFPKPAESEYDSFIAGHSSTSLSSAIGLARAKLLKNDPSKVVAVLGDGAFVGGMVYEAINNIDPDMKNLVVVLNDNSMSISKSVGSIARYLMHVRTDSGYSRLKKAVQRTLQKTPLVGDWIARSLLRSKLTLRRFVYGGTLFEELGFNYIGLVDGHDVKELERIFSNVRNMDGPILVHVATVKGKGFALAEQNPGAYHGVGQFDIEAGNPDIAQADSFSNVFGKKLCDLADTDSRICAVTAAMKYGTGLHYFYKHHRERFFDVGIAEEHAVTFCAGLARGGMRPVFSVYSTFLQRGFDQLVHDVSLSKLPVLLGIDRAGLVGDDGETHQGLLDVAMLGATGNFTVAAPSNYAELECWLENLLQIDSPTALRYPRGSEDARVREYACTGNAFDLITQAGDAQADHLMITYGREFAEALEARELLRVQNINCDILKLNLILPIDLQAVETACKYKNILFAEEGVANGGIGEHILRALNERAYRGAFSLRAIEKPGIAHATMRQQLEETCLDAAALAAFIMDGRA